MVRDDILRFLRDPRVFAADVSEPSRADWLAGLAFARQAIEASDEHALRDAQETGWQHIADHRAALILGPPGTGKTFALSWMTLGWIEGRRAAGRPCRVLVTGFTRNAIANLLEAVSRRARHAAGPLELCWLGRAPDQSLPEAVQVVDGPPGRLFEAEQLVVGATTWSLYKAIDALPRGEGPTAPLFDLVCIDEASQMVVGQGLASIAGLAPGGRVLVAGDDNQLAPVRETHEREIDGRRLGASLYGFLQHAGVAEFALNETFRLNALLSDYPARAFYDGDYISAAPVRARRLDLREGWQQGLPDWARHALDPDNPVCVLLYDGPLCGTRNRFEADLAAALVGYLQARMLPAEDEAELSTDTLWQERLAVVSPHRAQNGLLRRLIRGSRLGDGCVVETVDRIQGRERDAIIASYTVSDPEFARMEAEFIFSPERFNVTVTRARTKLVLIVSRDLLDTVPEDEALFDRSQVLRTYVYETDEVGVWSRPGPGGVPVPLTVRVRRFDDAPPIDDSEAPVVPDALEPPPDEAALRPELAELLAKVRELSASSRYDNAADFDLRDALSRAVPEIRDLLLELHGEGLVTLGLHGQHRVFWSAAERRPPRRPFECTAEGVDVHIDAVLHEIRGGRTIAPYYFLVRRFFRWLDADGSDRLRPLVDALVESGRLRWGEHRDHETLERADRDDSTEALAPSVPLPLAPEESDFVVLNALEEIEQRRINFGLFDSWVQPDELADAVGRTVGELGPILACLRRDGWLMTLDDERLRSRAAELARELRYVKQRFSAGDAHKRPFLVRSTKVEFRSRNRPIRDRPLKATFESLKAVFADEADAHRVLDATFAMLSERWSSADPPLSGFQARALLELLPAWFGHHDGRSFVITADTGSGKTEAAGLPLIMATAIDALRGTVGTRAVLVYPRIRLANNQAQRLTGYVAALAKQPGMPTLTIGVANSEVPGNFDRGEKDYSKDPAPMEFALFGCPDSNCAGDLQVLPTGTYESPDTLSCTACEWRFAGWVGSKKGLGKIGAGIFITTTESLHSWLHSQHRRRLFGDLGGLQPPRALLADEIHLYSHIQGAQVGYALRRLLARIRLNGGGPGAPLAIGMSATLDEAPRIWETLCGQGPVTPLAPAGGEREHNPRSREYFYFVQPEVESRGKAIAGASTTIQALMCLAHGMRRRTGDCGGYRALCFLDSIDKVKRLHGDYADAEGQSLAELRTTALGTVPPESEPRRACCDEPSTCARFADGECWYFAARDPHQVRAGGPRPPGRGLTVTRQPVFSGSSARVDDMIRQSDVVFSTSSLEVGFDDPDMALVYQHYAPLNMASFVQRKGRGGRGADDRPVTGVTLSLHSPRDSWLFHRPRRLLDAARFQVPLNMGNVFVRRGQLIATVLDAAARRHRGKLPNKNFGQRVFEDAARMAAWIFADTQTEDERLTPKAIEAYWNHVRGAIRRSGASGLAEWAEDIPAVPTRLFHTINLPAVAARFLDDDGQPASKEEDVGLALLTCAPGNATRRYGFRVAHWVEPVAGHAPWGAVRRDDPADRFQAVDGGVDSLMRELPRYLNLDLHDVAPEVIRPHALCLDVVGKYQGAEWLAERALDPRTRRVGAYDAGLPINPKSVGRLDGFLICRADPSRAQNHPAPVLRPLAVELHAFSGRSGRQTGLDLSRIYWGADCRLVVDCDDFRREEYVFTQTFVEPEAYARRQMTGEGKPPVQLYGYRLQTEGVRLELDRSTLDAFVEQTAVELTGTREERWLRGQFFRFLVLSRAPGIGLGRFQARELADLLVTARAFPETERRLRRLLKRWDLGRLRVLLGQTFEDHLAQSPLLTRQRLEKLGEALADVGDLAGYLRASIEVCADDGRFRGYLRSLVVHGVAVRLQQLFVRHGAGDPRRVLFHARLPIQFGEDADDVIVVCENGEHGDGTTRAFVESLDEAFAEFGEGLLSRCSNALDDAVLRRILDDSDLAGRWQSLDPTNLKQVERLADELGVDATREPGAVQSAVRLLTGAETLGSARYTYLELQREVHQVRVELAQRMDREPSDWELVSRVVRLASDADGPVPSWHRLLGCYRGFDAAPDEESLGPEGRLADQVYRLSAKFCVDGCQACLHTGSPLFPPQSMDATVSRRMLKRLERFLGWADSDTTRWRGAGASEADLEVLCHALSGEPRQGLGVDIGQRRLATSDAEQEVLDPRTGGREAIERRVALPRAVVERGEGLVVGRKALAEGRGAVGELLHLDAEAVASEELIRDPRELDEPREGPVDPRPPAVLQRVMQVADQLGQVGQMRRRALEGFGVDLARESRADPAERRLFAAEELPLVGVEVRPDHRPAVDQTFERVDGGRVGLQRPGGGVEGSPVLPPLHCRRQGARTNCRLQRAEGMCPGLGRAHEASSVSA